jgi:predicted pyridoxine 5'-phosphate oxidase superfamily flavin-nucleotide-binding protein
VKESVKRVWECRDTCTHLYYTDKKGLGVMILNDTIRQALTAGHLAHLVTLNSDGTPQVSVVWVGLDGDEIVSAHLNLYKKLKNIQRDARVALSMVTGGKLMDWIIIL